MKKSLLIIAVSLLLAINAQAQMVWHQFNGVIYVDKATVKEIEELFYKYGYKRFRALPDNKVPAIFMKQLPVDYADISSQKYRNELFIRILTPLAIKVNEEIANERFRLLRVERKFAQNKKLDEADVSWLEKMAVKYDYFTRAKAGENRIRDQIENLKLRINIVPPSILVAVAAMESNWGDSRVAKEANSLYKEKIWYSNEGLEPLENKDDGYRFIIFDSLIEGIRHYAHTFNSNLAYRDVWFTRAENLKRYDLLIGESMAYSLAHASNLPNYVGILDYTTAFYDLIEIDKCQLLRLEE